MVLMSQLQALRSDVIVKLVTEEKNGLIVIPKSALKYRQYEGAVFGEVVSVGRKSTLTFEREHLKQGDKIIFQRHEGKPIWIENEKYLVLKECWVLALIRDEVRKG